MQGRFDNIVKDKNHLIFDDCILHNQCINDMFKSKYLTTAAKILVKMSFV